MKIKKVKFSLSMIGYSAARVSEVVHFEEEATDEEIEEAYLQWHDCHTNGGWTVIE